ncbi:MAG TPA: hypothetical protein O0X70_04395 [Methanocorpusculum sp.]|nr:hypothetical protein [Methanocorpusculum sp.]
MAQLPYTTYGRKVIGEKSRFISLILNCIVPGAGIIYAGKTSRGILFFLLYVLCSAAAYICAALGGVATFVIPNVTGNSDGCLIASVILFIVVFFIWLSALLTGYGMCKQNNRIWTEFLEKL